MFESVSAVLTGAHVKSLAAAAPTKAPDAGGFYTWLTASPLRVILAIVAMSVIVGANRGRLSKAIVTLLIVLVGLFIMYGDAAMRGIAAWLGSYAA